MRKGGVTTCLECSRHCSSCHRALDHTDPLNRKLRAALADNVRLSKQLAEVEPLREFVAEVAAQSHDPMCPLNHPAYRHKWCNVCEAKKELDKAL